MLLRFDQSHLSSTFKFHEGSLIRESTLHKANEKLYRPAALLYTQVDGKTLYQSVSKTLQNDINDILQWMRGNQMPAQDQIIGRLATAKDLILLLRKQVPNYMPTEYIEPDVQFVKQSINIFSQELQKSCQEKHAVNLTDLLNAGYNAINGTGWFFGADNQTIENYREQKRLEKGDFRNHYFLLKEKFNYTTSKKNPGSYIIRDKNGEPIITLSV